MTEIHKYLSKTTESLSLSSVGIYSIDEGGEQNGDPSSTSPDYRQSAPRDRGETASAKETRDCITEEEAFRGKRPAISSSDQRAPRVESDDGYTCTLPRASSVCEGLLVARLVPRERCDYDAHKPSARTDPRPLLSALWKWQARGKEGGEGEEGGEEVEHATSGRCCEHRPASVHAADRCVMDDEDRVVMDLYLLRSSCLNERQRWEGDVDDETPQDRRKQRIHTLTSAFDATRNDSSRKENDASRNVFHLRMNRDSAEPASRTLRRLELSTTRKLRTLCLRSCHGGRSDGSDRSPRGSDEKVQRGKEENLAAIHRATSSKLVDRTTWEEADLTGLTTAEILRPSENGNEVWAVALTIPTAIVPWGNCVEDLTAKSNDSVYSSSPYDGVETVCLSMVSNPPTLLDVRTFESFSGELFVGVPLVIETDIIHATRAVVTWFADGEVAHCDSPTYSPKASDVGKRVSILVTPIRPGHNGSGCEEAYIFRNVVEPLPSMPIVELRDEWRRSRSVRSYQHNNLRVVTYNILADLYAGREVESYLMYGHCDAQDLRRQRRMPMIVAEILSYEADIICLQEVDAAVHDALLRPVLEANGYQGFYSNKVSSQQEGCSMFWSTSTFEPAKEGEMRSYPLKSLLTLAREDGDGDEMGLSRQSTHYYDAKSNVRDFELERWESLNGINHLFASHDEVRRVYRETVGQIVQIARLSTSRLSGVDSARGKPKSVVVSNTHLFYHPMAEHIRVLQAYAVCHKLEEIRREGQSPDPVLICGDFNSGPLSGAVRLLTHRSVLPNESHDCWKHLNQYRWECGDCEYMIDHGYIGNFSEEGELVEPCYVDEEFVDAHSDEASLGVSSTSNESTTSEYPNNMDDVCPPTIELPSSFPILASGYSKIPKFTNYAVDFVETLDYVFASMPSDREPFGFYPRGEAPMPSDELAKKHGAMPNKVMPSDHVAIVCDFEWVRNLK